jgi:hypothetical protein
VDITQGKNIADACKEVGVQHLIWSALPHVTKCRSPAFHPPVIFSIADLSFLQVTNGKFNLPHWVGKAEVDEYIGTLGIPATSFHAGFYISNMPFLMEKVSHHVYVSPRKTLLTLLCCLDLVSSCVCVAAQGDDGNIRSPGRFPRVLQYPFSTPSRTRAFSSPPYSRTARSSSAKKSMERRDSSPSTNSGRHSGR